MSYEPYRPSGFSLLPQVVKNLLIINGIFYLATFVLANQGIDLTDSLGLHYFQSEKFRAYQLITYMFMHGSPMHILFNMLALWMFGQAIENVWGAKRFLQYYIITGLGAAVLHYGVVYFSIQPGIKILDTYIASPPASVDELTTLLSSEVFSAFPSEELSRSRNEFIEQYNALIETNPPEALRLTSTYMAEFKREILNAPVVVGASGAIFGLLLAYGMLFPNSLIFLYFMIPIRAKYFVILYGAIELFSGILNVPGDNVAHFAHLGGLLFGFLLIQYWKRNRYRYP